MIPDAWPMGQAVDPAQTFVSRWFLIVLNFKCGRSVHERCERTENSPEFNLPSPSRGWGCSWLLYPAYMKFDVCLYTTFAADRSQALCASSPVLDTSGRVPSWSRSSAISRLYVNLSVGCHYCLRLPSKPQSNTDFRPVPNYTAWWPARACELLGSPHWRVLTKALWRTWTLI